MALLAARTKEGVSANALARVEVERKLRRVVFMILVSRVFWFRWKGFVNFV